MIWKLARNSHIPMRIELAHRLAKTKRAAQREYDLVAVALWSIIAVAIILLDWSLPVLRLAFGLPLALALPGYAFVAALATKHRRLTFERLMVSLAFSIIASALGGLLLHLLPAGLQASTWALLLGGITLAGCAVAYVRRSAYSATARQTSTRPKRSFRPAHAALMRHWLPFGLALGIALAAFQVSRESAINANVAEFSQLWMLPAANDPQTIHIGIANHEMADATYRLVIASQEGALREWESIPLQPGERWEATIALAPDVSQQQVTALLYRHAAPTEIYRRVALRQALE